MEKSIVLEGEVRSVEDWKKADGSLIGRKYQIEVNVSMNKVGDKKVGDVIFIDYDKERSFKVGQHIPATAVRVAISDFQTLHVEFHSVSSGNGNKPAEEKKAPNVKV